MLFLYDFLGFYLLVIASAIMQVLLSIEMGNNVHHLRGGEKKAAAHLTLWLYVAKFPLIERLKKQPYVVFLSVANIKTFSLEAPKPWDLDPAQVSCRAVRCPCMGFPQSSSPGGDPHRCLGWLLLWGRYPGIKPHQGFTRLDLALRGLGKGWNCDPKPVICC